MDITAAIVRLHNASTSTDSTTFFEDNMVKQGSPLVFVAYVTLPLFFIVALGFLIHWCVKRHRSKRSEGIEKVDTSSGSVCDSHDMKENEVILNEKEIKDTKASKKTETFQKPLSKEATRTEGNKEEMEALIGADGGSLSNRNITFTIPPGALKTSTNIRISTLPQENISSKGKNYFSISKVLHCEPSGLNFLKPYTVILNTCYHPIGEKDSIPLQVFVRKHNGDLWTKESQTTLSSDGIITFTAQHFSDRVLQAEERRASSLGRSLHSLVFLRSFSSLKKEIIWYVMDESAETFQRIKSLNQDAMKNNEYSIFSVQVNRNLSLNLQLTDSDAITLDRNQVSIDHSQFRQEKVAIPNKFLITKRGCRSLNTEVVSFSLSITETRPQGDRCYADVAEDKVCFRSNFHFTWGMTTEEVSSVSTTGPVIRGNIDNVDVGSNTDSERNSSQNNSQMSSNSLRYRSQFPRFERLSDNSVSGFIENDRSRRAVRPMHSSLVSMNLQNISQRQQSPVKPASRVRCYNSTSGENTAFLPHMPRRQTTNNCGAQRQLSASNNRCTSNRSQAVGRQIRCSGIHQPNSILSSFRTQQNLIHNISEEDESEMESPDNLHTDTSEGLLHNLNNYSSSEVESKSESDSDAYQHPRAITYV